MSRQPITIPALNGPSVIAHAARVSERAERVALMAEGRRPPRAATFRSGKDKARARRPKHRGDRYAE